MYHNFGLAYFDAILPWMNQDIDRPRRSKCRLYSRRKPKGWVAKKRAKRLAYKKARKQTLMSRK